MKVTILAVGSRGDTQPYVALGAALRARGFRVRVACSRTYQDLVTGAGLECLPLDADPRELLASEAGQAWLAAGRRPVPLLRRLRALVGPLMRRFLDEAAAACEGADAIVYSVLGMAGYHVAERRGIPACLAVLQPVEPTAAFPSVATPGGRSLGPLGNRLSHLLVEQLAWQAFRRPVNRWRREALGLPPLPLHGPYRRLRRERQPVLHAYSPTVVPRPADWPDHVHVTGYWFLDPPRGWVPPPDLEAFLAAGPPPVAIGFGSMVPRDLAAVGRLVLEATHRAGVRAVLLGDLADLPAVRAAGERVHAVRDVPHAWLFPRVAAAVHHGGAGTTAAALRAGVPSVACPFFADQPFWAERVHTLGAGPRPLPARRLDAAALAAAIRQATGDPRLRARAADLGRRVRAERGASRACDLIESWLGGAPVPPGHRRLRR